ncbi:hypothetical protein Sm713_04550 [Streptomyces sp. TS71-3]|nr:hypothetical protein Sm713_04550 [Streptomyces sp. TS71-3]
MAVSSWLLAQFPAPLLRALPRLVGGRGRVRLPPPAGRDLPLSSWLLAQFPAPPFRALPRSFRGAFAPSAPRQGRGAVSDVRLRRVGATGPNRQMVKQTTRKGLDPMARRRRRTAAGEAPRTPDKGAP